MNGLNGLLVINKPRSVISKDVSRKLVKALNIRKLKLGHVGTLDPMADGVLPLLFGNGTKLQDYLLEMKKEYVFELTLGFQTDSMDLDGEVIEKKPFDHVTKEKLIEALAPLRGVQVQIPPLYSAVKYKGRALYDYARKGQKDLIPFDELGRTIEVVELEFLSFDGEKAVFRMLCSKGTYVRRIAEQIADFVGTCGTVSRLQRTRAAGISLSQAVDLQQLCESPELVAEKMIPLERMTVGLGSWKIKDEKIIGRLGNGQTVVMDSNDFDQELLPTILSKELNKPDSVVMFIGDNDKAIGIGTVQPHENEKLSIKIRRGFN